MGCRGVPEYPSGAKVGDVSLLCGHDSVSPHTAQGTCRHLCLRAAGGGLPEPLRPTESPGRQRSGLAATKKWRPGRRRTTRLPTEERATQRASKSSVWVRATVAAKKARRTGAVELLRYAAE